jgi:uridine kinase
MLIIGIAGGTGSGKTTVVRKILQRLPQGEVVILPQDSYYRDSGHLPLEERLEINFDHPDSIEFELLVKHLKELKKGKTIEQPIYSYLTCTSSSETIPIKPCHVIIVEGILVLTNPELRKMMDLKVFVDADADDRLIRVINRDIIERGRSVNKVMERYECTVKPMHLQFIEPSKRFADLIIPQGGNNHIAIDILTKYIENNLLNQ